MILFTVATTDAPDENTLLKCAESLVAAGADLQCEVDNGDLNLKNGFSGDENSQNSADDLDPDDEKGLSKEIHPATVPWWNRPNHRTLGVFTKKEIAKGTILGEIVGITARVCLIWGIILL